MASTRLEKRKKCLTMRRKNYTNRIKKKNLRLVVERVKSPTRIN